MRTAETRVTSPLGTDIRFRVGDRPVNFQDGDASARRTDQGVVLIDREIELPGGAVRVAPVEDSVNGTIAFPPSQWNGQPVEGLRLRFDRGQVVEITASVGQEATEAELAGVPEATRAFREFALGFSPLLAVPDRNPWIPYYGYGSGVVRLSLGDMGVFPLLKSLLPVVVAFLLPTTDTLDHRRVGNGTHRHGLFQEPMEELPAMA